MAIELTTGGLLSQPSDVTARLLHIFETKLHGILQVACCRNYLTSQRDCFKHCDRPHRTLLRPSQLLSTSVIAVSFSGRHGRMTVAAVMINSILDTLVFHVTCSQHGPSTVDAQPP